MGVQNVLYWSKNHRLDWSDFQAEPNPAAFEDASCVIKYRCTWTVNSESFGNEIRFSIEKIELTPEFHRQLSWVRMPMATLDLLNHEQGHFDLAELVRTEIIEKIQSVFEGKWYPTRGQNEDQRKQFAREDSAIMITKELKKWEKYLQEKHEEYNDQTNYGTIADKQSEYDSIFEQLRK